MKKIIRILAVLFAALLAVAVLASCNQKTEPAGAESGKSTESEESNSEQVTPPSGSEGLEYYPLSDGTYAVGGGTAKYLTEVEIPAIHNGKAVTVIMERAFQSFPNLKKITIPNSVTSIGNLAFHDCNSLTGVYITDLAKWCNISFSDLFANPLNSAHQLYLNGTLITELMIPNGVTSIGGSAFCDCSSLTGITIPDSVTSISWSAFSGCSSLTNVTIPNSVTSIGYSAFEGCSSLTSITIPDSVTSIGGSAFSGCSSLMSITIPDSVTSIGNSAFEGCNNLIQKESGVWYVDKWVIKCETLVTNITLRNNTVGICDSAFSGCSSLTSITIPNNITSIGNGVFYGCSSLTSITIPDGVTSIGDSALYGCSSLTSITIPNSVTSIGDSAFYGCSGLNQISVAEGNTVYHSAGNCLIKTNEKILIAGCKSSIIPTDDSVTSISSFVFSGCSGLTSITIPNSVTSIGYYAFYGCSSLTSITIPDSVTSIGFSAFYGCSNLTSITIPFVGANKDGAKNINFGYIFGGWDFSDISECVPSSLKTVIITGGVSIGDAAFAGCSSLTNITLPNSVTSIGDLAFRDCSSLTSITYTGTKAQWNAISKYNLSWSGTVTCSDGIISYND